MLFVMMALSVVTLEIITVTKLLRVVASSSSNASPASGRRSRPSEAKADGSETSRRVGGRRRSKIDGEVKTRLNEVKARSRRSQWAETSW